MRHSNPLTAAAAVTLLLSAPLAHGAVQYTITEIGTFTGLQYSDGLAINRNGQVTGDANSGATANSFHAFLYSSGSMTDLGSTLPNVNSIGYGINATGQVVGRAASPNPAFPYSATVFTNGQITYVAGPAVSSRAVSINDNGHIVGTLFENTSPHAFLYADGTLHDLGTFGGNVSAATAINNSDQIVGWFSSTQTRAFLYQGGQVTTLPTLGGTTGSARAINDAGQIVGDATTAGNQADHAFLYDHGTMTDLGSIGTTSSVALSINNKGQVVGYTTGGSQPRAFYYANGTMSDLNTLIRPGTGWSLSEATGINDAGQITGYGYKNGIERGFLLTPLPEPATLILFATAAAPTLLGRHRNQRSRTSRRPSRAPR